MPVAQRGFIVEETSQLRINDDPLPTDLAKPINPPRIELNIFEQIRECIEKINSCKDGTSDDEIKIEKLSKSIVEAEEAISKAEGKRDALLRKNNFLRSKLDSLNERKALSIKYWQEFGFDVKQLSTPEDDFEQYEFIYKKLNGQEQLPPITVIVKLENKTELQIVSWLPQDALNEDVVGTLNPRLKADCHKPGDEHVDFKMAMLMIRKALIKHPDV